MTTIDHPEGRVFVEPLASGRNRVRVELRDADTFAPSLSWDTSYPVPLIERVLGVKGPAWLCDEIKRDEDPGYVERHVRHEILGYFGEEAFSGKTILDFGCGCGSSTMVLARILPAAAICGVELRDDYISVATHRAEHYGFDHVRFLRSPDGTRLPAELASCDFVFLSAVYEHLLPEERTVLLPELWSQLTPRGVLFLNQTPHRYFPLESHTTGLPLINYLPAPLVLRLARRFSRRVAASESWNSLLRRGIRGGTAKEILKILGRAPGLPILLEPERLGLRDRIDLWYRSSIAKQPSPVKTWTMGVLKGLKHVTGITLTPILSLAIRKHPEAGPASR